MLANSVIDLIGNAPLVKVNNIDTFGNEIYIKFYKKKRTPKN